MSAPYVDRIEGAYAVVIVGGRQKRVPLDELPETVREGDHLTADLSAIDPAATERARREVAALRKRARKDDGGDFSL